MKARIVAILSAMMICAMAAGMVLQHHHHRADGSVCLCMSAACHADEHHSHGDCDHDHSAEGEDCSCSLHLDEFCSKKEENHASVAVPDVQMLCVLAPVLDLVEETGEWVAVYSDAVPLRKFLIYGSVGLRAPPAVDVQKV